MRRGLGRRLRIGIEIMASGSSDLKITGLPLHPQVVGIGARRLRRFTVAPLTPFAEFQPRRLIYAEAA